MKTKTPTREDLLIMDMLVFGVAAAVWFDRVRA
jgi:hypothetical protein